MAPRGIIYMWLTLWLIYVPLHFSLSKSLPPQTTEVLCGFWTKLLENKSIFMTSVHGAALCCISPLKLVGHRACSITNTVQVAPAGRLSSVGLLYGDIWSCYVSILRRWSLERHTCIWSGAPPGVCQAVVKAKSVYFSLFCFFSRSFILF